jgi:two-component system response regulator FixJ
MAGEHAVGEGVVHVVDDDADVRRAIVRLLDSAGYAVIAYGTAEGFLDAVQDPALGCVLLDVYMPGMDGLELQSRLQMQGNCLPVIIMTGHGEVPVAVRAMKAGAVDFIEKPFEDSTLLDAIELAFAKGSKTTPEGEVTEAVQRVAKLSLREHQVLAALVSGKPNKVIAFDLAISVRTVEIHRARMMERLGVRQLAEAVRLAVLARLNS